MLRAGLLLAFGAVLLQIAVFLQPLLPKQYQIAPVCETISRALNLESQLIKNKQSLSTNSSISDHSAQIEQQHLMHAHHHMMQHQHAVSEQSVDHQTQDLPDHDHSGHQCQYCTVLGHLILPPELDLQPVVDRIQVRLIAFQKAFRHVYFVLQRLFLLPQGRAPPLFA